MKPFILILITMGTDKQPDVMESVFAYDTLAECHAAARGTEPLETVAICIEGREQ